jgi:glutamate dehydrogenase (NAD(P)+)
MVNQLLEGATEFDIVKSGLEEIMCSSTNEVINTSLKKKVDLRTAAYMNAINRLHEFFEQAGIQ